MKALQVAIIGLNNSGKSTVVNKLQQKEEFDAEKFKMYSFKQGDTLVYLADTPYNLSEPKEMIALINESDACLFCISAVDGINPKLGELMLLLNFLNGPHGVIAITKTDSSTSEEIASLKTKLKAVLSDSKLKNAEIVEVSSITGEGFDELRNELIKLEPKHADHSSKFTMPIETAKEIKSGFTTIFGVIHSGKLKKYDKLFVLPWGKELIVQEISKHGEIVEHASAGDRIDILFKGLYPWDVQTGDMLVTENSSFAKAKKIRFELEISKFFKDEIRTGSEIRLNIGLQTQAVTVLKISSGETEVQSAKPGDKVIIEVESKLPFAFEKNQRVVVVNPEAHWRSIKVVGFGTVKEGLE
jgi:selenocysteine-specific translation elongation factor